MTNDYSCFSDVLGCGDVDCVARKTADMLSVRKTDNTFYKQIVASSTGSIITVLSLNPITVVKVQLQSATYSSSHGETSSLPHVVRRIFSQHGLRGFWSGTAMGILMSVPNTVLYMSAYEHFKESLTQSMAGPSTPSYLSALKNVAPGLAGAAARMFSVSIISPLELIRTIQTGGVNKSISTILKQIYSEQGVAGLYRGWGSSVLRDCPFSGIYWLGFESLRPRYDRLLTHSTTDNEYSRLDRKRERNIDETNMTMVADQPKKSFSTLVTFLSGATSGMLAAVCTHPFDVLKTQQQIAAWSNQNSSSSNGSSAIDNSGSGVIETGSTLAKGAGGQGSFSGVKKAGTATVVNNNSTLSTSAAACGTLRSMYSQGGVRALFRGLSMRLVTVIPASAIMVTIYEFVKSL